LQKTTFTLLHVKTRTIDKKTKQNSQFSKNVQKLHFSTLTNRHFKTTHPTHKRLQTNILQAIGYQLVQQTLPKSPRGPHNHTQGKFKFSHKQTNFVTLL
jgi:hypothetical protein